MDEDIKYMTLTGHLRELRQRLIRSLIAVFLAFLVTYYYSEEIYAFLARPIIPVLPPEQKFMAFTGVVEPFFTYLKVAFVSALILASPVVLYQAWAFITPGLYENEKRWFLPLVCVSIVLFVSGVSFAYGVVFPLGFKYLLSFSGAELRPFLSMGLYFSLASKLLIAFGMAFQLPLLLMVLSMLGVVDARTLAGYWRYALILSVVAGAVLTPPDIFSQVFMGAPLMALYWIGVALAWIFGRKR